MIDRLVVHDKMEDALRAGGIESFNDTLLDDLVDVASDAAETLTQQHADKAIQLKKVDNDTRTATVASYDKMSDVSDGYHTFGELYHIRMLYNAAVFSAWYAATTNEEKTPANPFDVVPVKSWRHSDGELCFGKDNYFVVVAQLPTGQISNHYKGEYWDLFNIPEVEKAPEWDGHTPQEAADRLEKYLLGRF